MEQHNMSNTYAYNTWAQMKQRCYNPHNKMYKRYGGLGIKVCSLWFNSFLEFYKAMGERPSILYSLDRIDNQGDYKPNNCRWATPKEQCNNRRSNRVIKYKGQEKTMGQWAHKYGIEKTTLRHRIVNRGWSIERALTEPVRTYMRKAG